MIGKICGTGSYVPPHIMDNDDLSRIVDTNDAWIRERTGIARRHIIEDETTSYMAGQAALRAVEQSGIDPKEIELILVATSSSETVFPCAACEVQKMIGAVNAAGFDMNAACTGFVLAFNTAQAYISAGLYRTILVIGADSMTRYLRVDRQRHLYPFRRWSGSRHPSGRRGRAVYNGSSLRRHQRAGSYRTEQTPERPGTGSGR